MDEPAPSESETPIPEAPVEARGPVWFIREAFRVARLDTEAMGRVAKDPRSLFYGAFFVLVWNLLVALLEDPQTLTIWLGSAAIRTAGSAVGIGLCHGVAKVMFGASGSLVGLLRVIWLGSVGTLLALVPFLGGILVAIWSLLLNLVAFQEVDGIERLQALAVGIGVNAVIFLLMRMLV